MFRLDTNMTHGNVLRRGRYDWLRGTVVERWSLTSKLPCPTLDRVLTDDHLLDKPSTIGQLTRLGQLSLSSFQGL